MHHRGKASYAASFLEFDEVIDPAGTRKWIKATLQSIPITSYQNRKGGMVNSW